MKKRLLSLLIMTMTILAAFAPILPAHAESSSATVNIVITGTDGGRVKITRADGTSGDPNCSNSVSIPASGKDQTFSHDYPGSAAMNPAKLDDGTYIGEYYDYIVEQVPGTDKNVTYDTSKYTVRVYVGYSDETTRASVVVIEKDGRDEKPANISFTNTKKSSGGTVTTTEYKTITRYITYTERTANGKTVSKTVKQTLKLKRTKTENLDTGEVTYSKWTVAEGKAGAVKSPKHRGWKPNLATVRAWEFDQYDPHDEWVHVVYQPNGGSAGIGIDTGDKKTLALYCAVLALALVIAARIFAGRRKRHTS